MSKIVIAGGKSLNGSIKIQGSKNAVLPILAATVLSGNKSVLHNCPKLKDVEASLNILKYLNCDIKIENDTITVDSQNVKTNFIPENLMREMRSSIIFLGAIIARSKKAIISMPGGCELGARPIDLHLKAFRQMGIKIKESHGFIDCEADKIIGCNIHLDFPSVGATENIMLLASCANGQTVISNAAKEPEIEDLQAFLNAMGCKISGAGTDVITIEGVKELISAEHTVIPDRIVTTTYLACGAITKGDIEIKDAKPQHIKSVISILKECGSNIDIKNDSIRITQKGDILPIDYIRTLPYPGFPTDAQAILMSLLTIAKGTSIITENIFENRFKHTGELNRMGADIMVDGRVAVIKGVSKLFGANVSALDLRGGAALVVAGLAAEGVTEVCNAFHIDRGYEKLEENLKILGADIKRVK